MRRLLSLSIVAAALAVVASGCGSSSSSDQLSTALSYMPKTSAVVVAINTNLNSDQAKQVGKIVNRVPQGGQILNGIKQSVSRNGIDFEKDLKPLLGNDLVVSIPTAQALQQSNSPTIEAIQTKDGGKAKQVIAKGSTKVGTSHGADIYRDNQGGSLTAVEGSTIVGADTRALLDAALARHDGGDHMTKDQFDSALGDLDKSALVRGTGDLQAIIAGSQGAEQARKIKWVNALREFGFTAAAKSNAIAVDVQANSEGDLKDGDLPIASGSGSAAVIKRPGEINLGIRDPQQIYNFTIAALQATNPQQFGQFTAGKQQIGKKLGVDVDKDIVGQLTGDAAVSVATNGGFAARAALKDPAAFKASLAKVAKGLPALAKQFGGGPVAVSIPKSANGFYAIANGKTGRKVVFAVMKSSFVLGSDPARAAQFAVQSPTKVPGAQGSVALDIDTKTLVDQQLRKQGAPAIVQGFTGFLGDLTGYLKADTSSLRANFTLQLK